MKKLIKRLQEFVQNGGRLRAGEEPKYGEPFYGNYMQQYISANYNLGDKVSITAEFRSYTGAILEIYSGTILEIYSSCLTTLTSGKTVHKDLRNIRYEPFSYIKSIELIKKNTEDFDLSVIYPQKWNRSLQKKELQETIELSGAQREKRVELKKQFATIYPNIDYDKSHVIKIIRGCRLYFPFACENVSADLYLVLENGDCIKKIPCQTGAPFPNKNVYCAYNYILKQEDPHLYLYLPDNGFVYEDVNIVCIWTINITSNQGIKIIDMYRIEKINPISGEHNLIPIDMKVSPALGYKNINECGTLESMMDKDIYFVIEIAKNSGVNDRIHIIKDSENINEMKSVIEILYKLVQQHDKSLLGNLFISSYIETFVTIDKEADCYYSDSCIKCRDGYHFKAFDVTNQDTTR